MLTNNERGGALLYVLLIVMLIGILSPIIFDSITSRQLEDRKLEEIALTDQLAISAMESFIAYLNNVPVDRTTRRDYFNEYPGWGNKVIGLPSGATVAIRQFAVDPSDGTVVSRDTDGVYEVVIQAVTSDTNNNWLKDPNEPFFEEKTLRYAVNAVNASGGIIDENNPIPAEKSTKENIFHDEDKGLSGNLPSNVNRTTTSGLQAQIGSYLDRISEQIYTEIDYFRDAVNACGNCRIQNVNDIKKDLEDPINNRAGSVQNPVLVEVNNLNITSNVELGSKDKPVVLIVNDLTINRNNISITVFGTIIVKSKIIVEGNKTNFTIKEVHGEYGDLLTDRSSSKLVIKNNGKFDIDGIFFGNDVDVHNNLTFNAEQIILKGDLDVQNGATLNAGPNNMVVGGNFKVFNNNELNISGDLLIKGDADFYKSAITTGGYIGIGGNFNIRHHQVNFETGVGGTTIIQIPPGSSGGGVPVNNNWNITRN